MNKTILFDLDGTLTDPKEGITKCIQYALEKLGRPVPPASELEWCIGPPLLSSFQKILAGTAPSLAEEALDLYRVRFREKGMFENTPYPEISSALELLTSHGFKLLLATSKPSVFATEILDHFGLARFFTRIYGSELNGRFSEKADLIRHILDENRLSGADTIMVGDREHDVIGAKKNGIASIGVTYGYGSREELQRAGADFVVDSPRALVHLLTKIHTKMSAAQKWETVLRLRETAWQIKAAAVRSKHLDWSELEVRNEVRKIFLYAVT